jgi:hypothetical protein
VFKYLSNITRENLLQDCAEMSNRNGLGRRIFRFHTVDGSVKSEPIPTMKEEFIHTEVDEVSSVHSRLPEEFKETKRSATIPLLTKRSLFEEDYFYEFNEAKEPESPKTSVETKKFHEDKISPFSISKIKKTLRTSPLSTAASKRRKVLKMSQLFSQSETKDGTLDRSENVANENCDYNSSQDSKVLDIL